MPESGIFYPGSGGSLAVNRIPRFGEALADIALNFSQDGALGLIVVDASAMADIEASFGSEAHQKAMAELGAMMADLVGDRLEISVGISSYPHPEVRRREDLFARARNEFLSEAPC